MSEIYYVCPECKSTNLMFDVSGATYDANYQRFTAYVNQEKWASCVDCKSAKFTALRKECEED